jgi:hypothetical protein
MIGSFPLRPCVRTRQQYYELRHLVRLLRKYHPWHPDVSYHSVFVAVEPTEVIITKRMYDKKGNLAGLGIVQPLHKIPG